MPGSHVGEAHVCVPWGWGCHQQELLLHWVQHGAEQETGVSEPWAGWGGLGAQTCEELRELGLFILEKKRSG